MPFYSCDHAARGEAYAEFAIEVRSPNGSGKVLAEIRYVWDGVSVFPACDGQVIHIRTRNTSNQTAWALLPDKKRGDPWVQIDPGADITTTSPGTLNNLGLSKATDVQSVRVSFVNPAG